MYLSLSKLHVKKMFNDIVNNTILICRENPDFIPAHHLPTPNPNTSLINRRICCVRLFHCCVYLRLRFVRLETTNTICGWRS